MHTKSFITLVPASDLPVVAVVFLLLFLFLFLLLKLLLLLLKKLLSVDVFRRGDDAGIGGGVLAAVGRLKTKTQIMYIYADCPTPEPNVIKSML
jgi:hypothetical protein